jgi:general secretion pathway protein K
MASVEHVRTDLRDRGFALVIVLWSMLLISVLGVGLLLEVRASRTIANTQELRIAGRLLADGAINRIIMSLLDRRDPLRLPLDGSPREIDFLGARIIVACESEAGKIDLNTASRQLLTVLFRAQGLSSDDVTDLTGQIESWRSPLRSSSIGDASKYADAGRSYGPRYGPFRSIGELRLVLSMTDALQSAIAPVVTIWSGNSAPDLSVANEKLLSSLAANDNFAATQLSARQQGNAAGANRAAGLGEVLTIHASIDVSGVTVTRSASIQIAGDLQEPYRVLAWQ